MFFVRANLHRHMSSTTQEIREGSAVLQAKASDVFYNNVQCVNRDMSVVVLNSFAQQWRLEHDERQRCKAANLPGWRKSQPTWTNWGKPVSAQSQTLAQTSTTSQTNETDTTFGILEALSASGLRSIRYAKEVAPWIKKRIIANDRDLPAVESIRSHTTSNGPYENGTVIEPSHADAVDLMHRKSMENDLYQVVDLDPYGAPSEFLDSAVRCVDNGGLLCVTATDTAVLCGSNTDKSRPKYGVTALHRPYGHEMAIRLVLSSIDTHANRYGKFIVPLLSLQLDFYVRVFVRVYSDQPNEVKKSGTRQSYVFQSKLTDTFKLNPVMVEEKNKFAIPRLDSNFLEEDAQSGCLGGWMIGGPMWSAPIHNYAFIEACLDKIKEFKASNSCMQLTYTDIVQGTLAAAREEIPDSPLYYDLSSLCKTLHCTSPPLEKFQAALMNAGFKVSQSHNEANAIKTDAPPDVIWDILRCWVERHPVGKKRLEEKDSVLSRILTVKPKLQANFDSPRALRQKIAARASKDMSEAVPKWHQNPEKHWGPKTRTDRRPTDGSGESRHKRVHLDKSDSKQ